MPPRSRPTKQPADALRGSSGTRPTKPRPVLRLLNQASSRSAVAAKRRLGFSTSAIAREVAPASLMDLEAAYAARGITRASVQAYGEVTLMEAVVKMRDALAIITPEQCGEFLVRLVFEQSFDGYCTEKVVGRNLLTELPEFVGLRIEEAGARDETEGVDLRIWYGNQFVGVQVKPLTFAQSAEAWRYAAVNAAGHARFQKRTGRPVFTVVCAPASAKKKVLCLLDSAIVADIRAALGAAPSRRPTDRKRSRPEAPPPA